MALLVHCDTLQFVDGALVGGDSSYGQGDHVLAPISGPCRWRSSTRSFSARETPSGHDAGPVPGDRWANRPGGRQQLRPAEWDWLEPYVELGPAMQQAIVDNGGRISLRRLQRVVAAAGFSPNSVVLYAQMHPVFVFEDDVVRLRERTSPLPRSRWSAQPTATGCSLGRLPGSGRSSPPSTIRTYGLHH